MSRAISAVVKVTGGDSVLIAATMSDTLLANDVVVSKLLEAQQERERRRQQLQRKRTIHTDDAKSK